LVQERLRKMEAGAAQPPWPPRGLPPLGIVAPHEGEVLKVCSMVASRQLARARSISDVTDVIAIAARCWMRDMHSPTFDHLVSAQGLLQLDDEDRCVHLVAGQLDQVVAATKLHGELARHCRTAPTPEPPGSAPSSAPATLESSESPPLAASLPLDPDTLRPATSTNPVLAARLVGGDSSRRSQGE
jgi:hypothetical protein